MKLALLFICTFVVTTTSVSVPTPTLGEELKEFRALLPLNKISAVILKYAANDLEFQELVEYILSDNVFPAFEEIESIPEVKAIIKYLHERGSDIYDLLNKLHKILGLDPYYEEKIALFTHTQGLVGFFKEIEALIPAEKLRELYEYKLKTSLVFREFVDFLKSKNSQKAMDNILRNDHVLNLLRFLKRKNVSLQVIADFITGLLGIQFKPIDPILRKSKPEKVELMSHISEFIALVHTKKVIDCGNLYMKSSKDFRVAHLYLSSKSFEITVKAVTKTPESKKLTKYLETKGFILKKFQKLVEAQLGFKKLNAKDADDSKPPKTGNLTEFLNDVTMLLPKDEIKYLAGNKTLTVPAYANFTVAVQSTEFFALCDDLVDTKEVRNLVTESAEYGVTFDGFVKLAYSLLGLELKGNITLSI